MIATEPMPPRLAELFGMEKMNLQQQEAFFKKTGDLLIDATITKLLLTLTEEEMLQIKIDMDEDPDMEDPFSYFLDNFPQFEGIVREQVAVLQDEIAAVMG